MRRTRHSTMTKTFSTKGEARTWVHNTESSMDSGAWCDQRAAHRTTLAEALDDYQRLVVAKQKSHALRVAASGVARWEASR
ncbi:hypothetical protein [Aquisalimonas sp.]|uniref:hypothetical protein n=1 Tax=Aquisalimonas sp. TaxID=1872621 RepID=UPI0025BF9169|nr:hypothetical protein [Aquisalimonas sp.]